MRRLGTRRYRSLLAVRYQPCAIAHGEDILVARRLQCGEDDKLTRWACLQAVEIPQHLRTAHAGRPDHQLRRNKIATGEKDSVGPHLGDPGAGPNLDAEL